MIRQLASISSRWWTRAAVSLLAISAFAATWLATRHGALLSPDSVTYLSLARNLAAGRGYIDFTGQPNTTFAPGFPAVLAVGHLAGFSVPTAARIVNAASAAGIVVLAWVLVRRHTGSLAIALGATAFIAISPTVLNVADHAWSEPLFCFVLLGFILLVEDAVSCSEPHRQLYLAASAGMLCGVAFVVRYAALPLIVVGVVALLSRRTSPGRWASATVFLAAAIPLPLAWLFRNARSGAPYLLGPRMAATDELDRLVTRFLKSVNAVITDGWGRPSAQILLAVTVALCALGLTLVARHRGTLRETPEGPTMVPVIAFIALYSAFLVASGVSAGSSIDARTVMPIFVPVIVVVAWSLSRVVRAGSELTSLRLPHAFGVALAAALLAILAIRAVEFAQMATDAGRASRGYATASPASSPLARATLVNATPNSIVTTNNPWTLYSATKHQPIVPMPGPLYPSASLVPSTSDELADASCRHPVYFARYARSRRMSSDLGGGLQLTVVARVADGVLYAVHAPSHECASDRPATSA